MQNGSTGTVVKKDLHNTSFKNRDAFLTNGLNAMLTTTNFDTGSTYLSASNLLGNVNT